MSAKSKGVNATGRTIPGPAGILKKRNSPPKGERFIWMTEEMMQSPAFCALSINGYRVLHRLMLEHVQQSGQENGNLICTYSDFVGYGVRRNSVSSGLGEVLGVGLVAKTVQGGFSEGSTRHASKYRLEWLPDKDGRPATNAWKRYKTLHEAVAAAGRARLEIKKSRILNAAWKRKMQLAAREETKRAIERTAA